MSYVADLHVHSPFARGTSKQLTFPNLATWAKLKGIDLLATGNFTHPGRLAETRATLRPRDNGLFELDGTLFILGTEVTATRSRAVETGGSIFCYWRPTWQPWAISTAPSPLRASSPTMADRHYTWPLGTSCRPCSTSTLAA